MKQKNILETPRLLLREMDESDLPALKEIVTQSEEVSDKISDSLEDKSPEPDPEEKEPEAMPEPKAQEEAPTEVVLNRYRYDFTIDDFGAIKEISIDSFQETSGVIVHYLNSLYPNSKYRILSYKETETIVRDGAHDWLPDDLFKAVNGFDKEITHVIKLTVKIR